MASFSDNFGRPDGSPGAGWVLVSGPWTIIAQQLSAGTAGGTVVIRAATAMDTSDHSAQVTIAATTSASQGVWCRGDSTLSQGYLWRNNGSVWALFSVVAGVFTSIGTYSAAAVAGDVAKIQAVGSTIKGYVGGVERVSVVNTAVTTGTSTGLRSDSTSALRYDDFTAADVTAGATLGVATAAEAAQPLTGAKAATLGTATETSAAQPLTGSKTGTLGVANALESAQPLTGSKSATLNTAFATETAQPVTGAKTAALGTTAASEAAQQLIGSKQATLGVAAETSTAQPLTFVGPQQRPADRLAASVPGPALTASTRGPLLVAVNSGPRLAATTTTGG